jgi:hypothetical protein
MTNTHNLGPGFAASAVAEGDTPPGDRPVPVGRASALDVAERAFRLLTSGPDPLALDCAGLGSGVPPGVVPLHALREVLTRAAYPVVDRVWPELVLAAQQGGPAWLVGVVGVALPGLRRIAARVAAGSGELREDLDSEVLAGFCTALTQADPDGDRLLNRLYWAAERAGRRRRAQETTAAERGGRDLPSSTAPRPPSGHPDLVLAAAVRDGVLTQLQAELIGQTRLDRRPLREVAAEFGLTYEQLRRRRRTGERNLVAALTTTPDNDEEHAEGGCRSGAQFRGSGGCGTGEGAPRPGHGRSCRDRGRRAWPTRHQPERRADSTPAAAPPGPVALPPPTSPDVAPSRTEGHAP